MINPMPNNNDPLYANTWHYEIREKGKVIYAGHTTQTIEKRLREHWETARTNPRDEFHKYLINCDESDITITTNDFPEPIKHKNKADAERLENQHIKSYFVDGKNTLLNTRVEIKEFKGREPIKLTSLDDDKLLTLDKLNKIKKSSNKIITPSIYDDTKNKRLKIYCRIDGQKHDTTIGYNKKRTLEEAMEEANRHIQKIQERYEKEFQNI